MKSKHAFTLIELLVVTLKGQWPGYPRGPAENVWEMSSRRRITTLRGHVPRVTSLAVSPDGRTLASGDRNGLIKL